MWSFSKGFGVFLLFLLLPSFIFSSTYFEISEEELTELETTLERQENRLQQQERTLSELSNIIETQQSVLQRQSNLIGTLETTIEQLDQSFSAYEREVRFGRIMTIAGSAGAGFTLGVLSAFIIGGR